MINTTAKIVEDFLFPHVSPIIGQPTYDSLAEIHLKVNANKASAHSNLGNGLLGLLYLTISPAVYGTLSTEPFIRPPTQELQQTSPTIYPVQMSLIYVTPTKSNWISSTNTATQTNP